LLFNHDRALLENRCHCVSLDFTGWSLIKRDALEELEWDELDDKSNNQLDGSDHQADHVLFGVQWVSLYGSTSILDHAHLDDKGEDGDVHEQHVSENTFEHVLFTLLKLSGVDLIENLHEHESLEHKGEVEALLSRMSCFKILWKEFWLRINNGLDTIMLNEAVKCFLVFFLPSMDIFWMSHNVIVTFVRIEEVLIKFTGCVSPFFPGVNGILCLVMLLSVVWVLCSTFKGELVVWVAKD